MKKKFDWNVPMTRKNWAVVYTVTLIFTMVSYTWMFYGNGIVSMIKKLVWKEHKNPVEQMREEKWSFDNEDD